MLLVIVLVISLLLSGCASIEPPVGEQCFINGRSSYKLCYKMPDDFSDDGKLKPSARGIRTPIKMQDLHGFTAYDPNTHDELLRWGDDLRDEYEKGCKP